MISCPFISPTALYKPTITSTIMQECHDNKMEPQQTPVHSTGVWSVTHIVLVKLPLYSGSTNQIAVFQIAPLKLKNSSLFYLHHIIFTYINYIQTTQGLCAKQIRPL